ncbi:MAG: DNA repair protein RecN [Christensenellaceae bacterium]|jgi:DNA repair protein RecN (Recombination protein N)|nr:DNA repair protein RecN [Christensenellaceae bacterium]
MLSTIRIQNVALIPAVEINFKGGFNVLTGETGAGKSIIIGSLNFIFGERLSTNIIRSGSDFAKVTAVFDEDIIVRTLYSGGRNEIRINDDLVTVKQLKNFVSNLIDIHGQHDTEKLLDVKHHIELVDGFGGISDEVLNGLQRELRGYVIDERELDFIKFQIDEIEAADIKDNEEEELRDRLDFMRKAERNMGRMKNVLSLVMEADNLLCKAVTNAKDTELFERISGAECETGDIANFIRDYLTELDFDEGDFEKVEERMETIKKIKKKYGDYDLEKLKEEYERQVNAKERVKELNDLIAAEQERLLSLRKSASGRLETELLKHLSDLGMPNAKFETRFDDYNLEFYFSANVGEPVKPLRQIISGGEMSRVALSIKTVTNLGKGKTIIFDEIDTGISGIVGNGVAAKLKVLAENTQIIAVTHLASIAAAAETHFLIEKQVAENKTVTQVIPLEREERVNEVARILGGGETAVAHARSLFK